jgi:hypothetical protein
MSPTPPYFPLDIEAPILNLPENSPLWLIAAADSTTSTHKLLTTSASDEAEAREVIRRMATLSIHAETVATILDGRVPSRYPSRSEADQALVGLATHFLRGNPRRAEILTAILVACSLKAPDHYHPENYISHTVAKAESWRDMKESKRIGGLVATRGALPKGVYDAKLLTKCERSREVEQFILDHASSSLVDSYTRNDRWRRLPVQDVATLFGVSREAVRLRLVSLEDRGLIERRSVTYDHDGAKRKDSLIRLKEPCTAIEAA